jgi:hypothetical protein
MSAQVVKGVLSSGLLSNPLKLLSVVSDAAAAMTTDGGMSVSNLISIGDSLRSLSSQNVQFITAPNMAWPADPNRVEFAQPQASQVFSAIAHDMTVPKVKIVPTPSVTPQVLTTNPSQVKVQVLNGSGASGIAKQAAAQLTSRGFDVTGTGDAASFAYTKSVIEYSSATDRAQVNTLKQQLTDVTTLQVSTLTPGTVDLIIGSDFTGLNSASATTTPASDMPSASASASASASGSASTSPSASASGSSAATGTAAASPSASGSAVSNLAQSNNGITAAASCSSDSSAFAGG